MRKAALLDQIPSETWQEDWTSTVRRSPTPRPRSTISPPYIFKVAISDHRILKVEETSVSFKTPGSGRLRTLTLDPLEFIRRFLQHVLLKGFMKVRYYGFLSPTAKPPLEDIKALIELAHGFTVTVPEIEPPPWPLPICQTCGGDYASIRCLAPDPLQGGGMGALPIEVAWEVAHDECFRRIARRGVTLARPEDAHSVHVEPTGLAVP